MDVDGAGEIRGAGIVEPIVIREPGSWFGDGDQLAAAGLGDVHVTLIVGVQHTLDAFDGFQNVFHAADVLGVFYINMGHLMIRHGECGTFAGVEQFESEFFPDRQQTLLPQRAIQMHRLIHFGYAVFG